MAEGDVPMKNGRLDMDALPDGAIVMGGHSADFPPWTDDQRDAQIEALRYAVCELAATLHEQGTLDIQKVNASLGNAEWLYADKSPDTLNAVRWIADTLAYMRTKRAPRTRRPGKTGAE